MTSNRLIFLGLLASLSINLFFVGGIAYRVLNAQDQNSGRPLPPNIGWVVRDLDEQRRSELEPQLQASFDQIRPLRGEMIAAQRQVNELMSAQPFDAAALADAFATLRDTSMRYQTLSHEQTSEILNLLTEEERNAALEFVQRRGPRDGRDGFRGRTFGGDRGGPDGPGGRDGLRDGPRDQRPPPPATADDIL